MTLLILATIVAIIFYKRYFPVFGVHCINLNDLDLDKIKVIDLRDYNESYKNPIKGVLNIPIAYLKRNLKEIQKRELHLIVSSHLEKNIGIRCLRKKGYCVVGYTIVNHHQLILKENSLKNESNCKREAKQWITMIK
jgi:rhodanese-related sulfurtransferase